MNTMTANSEKKFLTRDQVGEKLLSSVRYAVQSLYIVEDPGEEPRPFTSEESAMRWQEAKPTKRFMRSILAVCYFHPHNLERPLAYVELPEHYSKVIYCHPDLKAKAETMLRIPEKDLKVLGLI